ncbi:MAG: RluA family pseudouridine synthase [Vicinamibacterales bacterium]
MLWRRITLDRGDAGVRVDRVLLRHLRHERGVSRTRIQRWIDAGDVLVNGRPAPRAAWRLTTTDDVRVRLQGRRERARPAAESIPIDVLYHDDDLLAVNKPAGLVSHPSHLNTTGTLLNGILAHARRWPTGSKPGLLGRLDKQTSGVVLVSKRPAVQAALQRAAAALRVDKEYLAIVWGKPTPQRGTIDLALDRDPWDRRRVTVTDRGGQPAVTRYERLATSAQEVTSGAQAFSLVRCRLITGRTHQIRVHLAAKGWPIVGDAVYGRPHAFPRQALHAWRLTLTHPTTRKELTIVAPLPDDMRRLCDALDLSVEYLHELDQNKR